MKQIRLTVLLAFLALMACMAQAFTYAPLSTGESAGHGGATHCAFITYADLTKATTNTAQTLTNAVPAGRALEFVAFVLDTAFTVGTTNWTDSLTLKVGDGSDDDLFLASTELASDGSEVFAKFAPASAYTAVSTPTTVTTNLITLRSGATNVSQTVTNAVVKTLTVATANTAGELGRKYYSTAGSLILTFTPDSHQAVASFDTGALRLYFKEFATKR